MILHERDVEELAAERDRLRAELEEARARHEALEGDLEEARCELARLQPKPKPCPPRCNLCGLSTGLAGREGPGDHGYGLTDVWVSGGYESTPGNGTGALDDLTNYRFSLCEFCVDWLMAQFRLPVHINHSAGDDSEPERDRRPAVKRVTEDGWRSMKGTFAAEYALRAAARAGRELRSDEGALVALAQAAEAAVRSEKRKVWTLLELVRVLHTKSAGVVALEGGEADVVEVKAHWQAALALLREAMPHLFPDAEESKEVTDG